jgi:putative ABC transport system ATP-binding protein
VSPNPTRSPDALTPATGTETAVRLVDVHKTYDGATPVAALRGVSLDFARGSLTAVMGQSGSGKSTLLNVAAGLDVPTRGQVVIGGTDTSSFSPDDLTRFRRDQVGFIFQSYNLIGHLDVRTNIELPLVWAVAPRTAHGSRSSSGPSASRVSRTACPASCPEGRPSGWPSPAR